MHLQVTEAAKTYLLFGLLPLNRPVGDAASSLCCHIYHAACTFFVANASHEVKRLPVGVGSGWSCSTLAISLEDTIRAHA